MSASPAPVVMMVLMSGIFTALIAGDDLVEQLWPSDSFVEGDDILDLDLITLTDCNANETSGFFADVQDAICFIGNIFKTVGNGFIFTVNFIGDVIAGVINTANIIIAVVLVLVGFFTFNIPGAPTIVRIALTSLVGFALTYAVYDMVRGR